LRVNLAANSGADSPGAVLASFNVMAGTLGTFGVYNAPVSFSAPPGITLTAGTQYWVTVADISGGTDTNLWNWNSTGDSSDQAISTDGGMTWFSPSGLTPGAYELGSSAATVPEPSTLVLLSSGVIGLLGSRWRRLRRRTQRPTTNRPQIEQLEDRIVLSTTFTWTQANSSGFGGGTMLQMPNGTIMMQGASISPYWNVLAPSNTGSYVNNFQPSFSTMTTPRLYMASVVLPNSNVFVLGGEYSGAQGLQNEINTGEMYSSATNTWSPIANFPQPTFGDDSGVLLGNGLILLATGSVQGRPYTGSALTYLYNPTSSAITAMVNGASQSIAPGAYSTGIPNTFKPTNVEEGWVKLPDGGVLSYDEWSSVFFNPGSTGYAEIFNPATGTWQDVSPATGHANGAIPPLSAVTDVNREFWMEMGPPALLNNGNVFIVSGGTTNTALYNPTTNTWSAGPSLPFPFTADDAPGAVLPNGDVIFTADSALATGRYTGPTGFFDYSPSAGTITQLTGSNAPPDPGLAGPSFVNRLLVLPTGQLMFTDAGFGTTYVGTPSGAPLPQWRPVVTGITGSGSVYTVTGLRLNGMSAGAYYGDDAQMDENYPIVRFTNSAGTVYYATTSNWSLLGAVATGNTPETVTVTLPPEMPAGNYSLVVSGAGVDSFPVAFHLAAASLVLASPGTGSPGGIMHVGQTPGHEGVSTPPSLQTSVTNGQTTGLPAPPPLLADLSNSNLGVLLTGFSVSIGGTLDELATAMGYTPDAFTNAVDAVFASDDLAWFQNVFRVRPGSSARTLIGPAL
jgi:hypothetical protein